MKISIQRIIWKNILMSVSVRQLQTAAVPVKKKRALQPKSPQKSLKLHLNLSVLYVKLASDQKKIVKYIVNSIWNLFWFSNVHCVRRLHFQTRVDSINTMIQFMKETYFLEEMLVGSYNVQLALMCFHQNLKLWIILDQSTDFQK